MSDKETVEQGVAAAAVVVGVVRDSSVAAAAVHFRADHDHHDAMDTDEHDADDDGNVQDADDADVK